LEIWNGDQTGTAAKARGGIIRSKPGPSEPTVISRHSILLNTAVSVVILVGQHLASPLKAAEGSPGTESTPSEPSGSPNAGITTQSAKPIGAISGLRLRTAPQCDAALIATLPVGEILTVIERSPSRSRMGDREDHCYQVHTGPQPGGGNSGWVFGALTLPFAPASPDAAYRTLLERRVAAAQKRAWAVDLDLLTLIARQLKPAQPSEPVRALAGPALDRIGESLKTACRSRSSWMTATTPIPALSPIFC
jgi:hypothetical protein